MEKQKAFFKSFINSDLGLRTTYWNYGVGASILTVLLDYIAIEILASEILSMLISLTALAYFPFISIAIFRAAHKYQGNKFWPILAQLIVIFGIMKVLATFIAPL